MIVQVAGVDLFGGSSQNLRFEAPDQCPLCHHAVQAVPFGQSAFKAMQVGNLGVLPIALQAVFRCPRPPCSRLFIARFVRSGVLASPAETKYWDLVAVEPKAYVETPFDKEIAEVSPQFVTIYNQASAAESAALDQLCGPGYRKALEFLVKDYVKSLPENAGKQQVIEKTQIGPCISTYVRDQSVKSCARRATWLGNDETHYVRKWEDKDITDLKKLVDLTVYWVSSEILTRELEASMPDPTKDADPKAAE